MTFRYDLGEDARFGFVLDGEDTEMLLELCNYMDKDPFEVIIGSIHKLHETMIKQVKNSGR